jgi:hypothetical protein
MNVYRIDYFDQDNGWNTRWGRNKSDAGQIQQWILTQYDEQDKEPPQIVVRPVYIPCKKTALLKWLNTHVTGP